ncbi:MAG: hypothetical protein II441_07905, partial [Oscillospiraceae bacterium]|nr:hypothetical protein [Oscillospiraceae bacterium]
MKEFIRKNGIKVGVIVLAVIVLIGFGSVARNGQVGAGHNALGIVKAPIQKAVSSAVNWLNSIYGYLYNYDSLLAENESLRSQLADAQESAREGIAASEENRRLRELLNLREKHRDYVLESSK